LFWEDKYMKTKRRRTAPPGKSSKPRSPAYQKPKKATARERKPRTESSKRAPMNQVGRGEVATAEAPADPMAERARLMPVPRGAKKVSLSPNEIESAQNTVRNSRYGPACFAFTSER
jgi:hypothetical protein